MLLSLLQGGDFKSIIVSLLLSLPVILFALTVHEASHGLVAYWCGDPTAKNLGRLTLNPLKHLDPIGFLCMMLVGYGWAKPVPINTRNFRNHKQGMALSAAAGPLSNLFMGIISAVFYGFFSAFDSYLFYKLGESSTIFVAVGWIAMLFYLGALFNFVFAFFNLIPVPPFDGSRLALVFLPPKAYFGIMRYERQILLGVLIAMILLNNFLDVSPFSWLADKLIDLIYAPVSNVFWNVFRNALLKA